MRLAMFALRRKLRAGSDVHKAPMQLRRSAYAHALPLAPGRVLLVQALSQMRLALDERALALFDAFAVPRKMPDDMHVLAAEFGEAPRVLAGAVAALMERGFLTEADPAAEAAAFALALGDNARDPAALLDRYRASAREGAQDYWATHQTRSLQDLGPMGQRFDIALIGDCDVQMEAEHLRLEARARGLDLHVVATFPEDVELVAERRFDAIVVGASRARGAAFEGRLADFLEDPRRLLGALRARSPAPILIDNLPEPTVQPLGLAERGSRGHRNRIRAANLALADLVEEFADVHLIDVAHTLAREGVGALVDDGLLSFTHLGSPGWLLQRPQAEKAAVHDSAPEPTSLAALVGGDPARRERLVARAHLDALTCILGLDAKKLVVVDLDGVLWPGVLAETGAPFAWTADISSLSSWIGVYVGLHEALKTLQSRGILLAAASRNDEAVVRQLWRWPEHYPKERLLTPDDFVTWRVGWGDKATSLREIAGQVGFAPSALLFIDDSAREREQVRAELPEVEIWGEDLYGLRRRLLEDPRLQRPRVTAEAAGRGDLVKAQLSRERLRAQAPDETAFRASLQIVCDVFRAGDEDLPRVAELFARTTQFNTTGAKFPVSELAAATVYAMRVKDRLADHGLVGAAVVQGGEIVGFALSCRVIGLGVEQRLLSGVVAALGPLAARHVETPRNGPARNLFRDGGFTLGSDGLWRAPARAAA
jgi:FkbH-like protein